MSTAQDFVNSFMDKLAGSASLSETLKEVFATILANKVTVTDGEVSFDSSFSVLAQVFTFVATESDERPDTGILGYGDDAIDQAKTDAATDQGLTVDQGESLTLTAGAVTDLEENTAVTVDTAVSSVTATGGTGDPVTYSITSGNDNGYFKVDPDTGAISIATAFSPDFDATESFTLTIQATDGTNTATVDVTVDVNEDPEEVYSDALAAYSAAEATVENSKAAAELADDDVSTVELATNSFNAATTYNTDALALVAAAEALVTAAADTASDTDDAPAAAYKTLADAEAANAANMLAVATVAKADAEAAAEEAAKVGSTYELEAGQDILTPLTDKSDTINGAYGTVDVDDIVVDTSSLDADVANLVLDANVGFTISGVETVNLDLRTDGATDVDAGKFSDVNTLRVDSTFGVADVTVDQLKSGTTVSIDKTTTDLDLDMYLASGGTSSDADAATVNLEGDVTVNLDKGLSSANDVDALSINSTGDKKNTVVLAVNANNDYVTSGTSTDSISLAGDQDLVVKVNQTNNATGLDGATLTSNMTGDATATLELTDALVDDEIDLSKVSADKILLTGAAAGNNTVLKVMDNSVIETGAATIVANNNVGVTNATKGGAVTFNIGFDDASTSVLTFTDSATVNIANTSQTSAVNFIPSIKTDNTIIGATTDINVDIGKGLTLGTVGAATSDNSAFTVTGDTAGADFTVGDIVASGAISMTVADDVTLAKVNGRVDGASDLTVTSEDVSVADTIGDANDLGNITLTTTKTVAVADTADILATKDVAFTAGTTIVNDADITTSTGNITVNAGTTLQLSESTEGDLTATLGNISLTAADALTIDATDIGITAGGSVVITSTNANISGGSTDAVSAGTTLNVTSGTGATFAAALNSGKAMTINTGTSLVLDDGGTATTEDITITTGTTFENKDAALTASAGDLNITAGTSATITDDIIATAGSVMVDAASITSATTGTIQAGKNVTLDSGSTITLEEDITATAGNVSLTAVGAVDVEEITVTTGNVVITTDAGFSNDDGTTVTTGNVTITAGTTAAIDQAIAVTTGDIAISGSSISSAATDGAISTASGTLTFTGSSTVVDSVLAEDLTATEIVFAGSGHDYVDNTGLDTITGNVTVNAGVDLTLATGDITGNLTVNADAAVDVDVLNGNLIAGNATKSIIIDETNTGTATTSLVSGSGDDNITLAAHTVDTTVDLGAGDDIFDGVLTTANAISIDGGAGNDTITGGSQADAIVGGTGNDIITGGIEADEITLGDGVDTVVINYAEAAQEDDVSDFVTGILGDQIDLSIAALETAGTSGLAAGATDFVLLGAGATPVAHSDAIVIQELSQAASATSTANIFVIVGEEYANTAAMVDALETGGSRAITTDSNVAANDAFIVVWSDGTDAHVTGVVSAAGDNGSSKFDAADLSGVDLVEISGVTSIEAGEFTTNNFDWIA